jgi:hypothetical protein
LKESPVVSVAGIGAPGAAEKKLGRLLAVQVQKRLEMGGKINGDALSDLAIGVGVVPL